jgi:hypothetical protein
MATRPVKPIYVAPILLATSDQRKEETKIIEQIKVWDSDCRKSIDQMRKRITPIFAASHFEAFWNELHYSPYMGFLSGWKHLEEFCQFSQDAVTAIDMDFHSLEKVSSFQGLRRLCAQITYLQNELIAMGASTQRSDRQLITLCLSKMDKSNDQFNTFCLLMSSAGLSDPIHIPHAFGTPAIKEAPSTLTWTQFILEIERRAENLQGAPTLLFSTQVKGPASILSTKVSFPEFSMEERVAALEVDKRKRSPSPQYSGSKTRYEGNEYFSQNRRRGRSPSPFDRSSSPFTQEAARRYSRDDIRTRRSPSPFTREFDRRATDRARATSPYSADRVRTPIAPTLSSSSVKFGSDGRKKE